MFLVKQLAQELVLGDSCVLWTPALQRQDPCPGHGPATPSLVGTWLPSKAGDRGTETHWEQQWPDCKDAWQVLVVLVGLGWVRVCTSHPLGGASLETCYGDAHLCDVTGHKHKCA